MFVSCYWFDCSCFTACPRVVTLTALQTAGAFVCAHDYRAVRTVQTAQLLQFVADSWLVVGTGELYAVVGWIPAAMWVQFAHRTFSLVRLLRIVRFSRESVVFRIVRFRRE